MKKETTPTTEQYFKHRNRNGVVMLADEYAILIESHRQSGRIDRVTDTDSLVQLGEEIKESYAPCDEAEYLCWLNQELQYSHPRLDPLAKALQDILEHNSKQSIFDEYANNGEDYAPDMWQSSKLTELFENAKQVLKEAGLKQD